MTRRILLLLLFCLFLAGCNLPSAPTGTLQAWIDAPLDGMTLPLEPYTIVFHGSGPDGVARMEVSVNGQVLATLPNPDPSQLFVYLTQAWSPQEAGRYIIQVRAQDPNGAWSEPDTVTVEVNDNTPTPTDVPTFTPTEVSTFTPTQTATHTPTLTPTPVPAEVFSNLTLSTHIFYRLDSLPRDVVFSIKVDDPDGVQEVRFYFRLRDPNTNETTEWTNERMASLGSGIYTFTLDVTHPALTPTSPKTMTLEYQFIVTHPDLSLRRSPFYADVTLQKTP